MKKLLVAFIATLSLNITAMDTEQAAAAPVDEGAQLSIQPKYTNVADYLRTRETCGPQRATQWAKPTCTKRMFAQPMYRACVGNNVAFSPDGTMIATAVGNKPQLWNLQGNCLATFVGHTRSISDLAFSPDGTTLATASLRAGNIKLWDLNGNCLATLSHTDHVWKFAFSPDSTMIASASSDRTAKLWDLNGHCLATYTHNDIVIDIAFSPDGQSLATASWDKTAKLWDLNGHCLATLVDQNQSPGRDSVSRIVFSPDGTTIAVNVGGSNTDLLDLKTNLKSRILGLNNATFSPDGTTIAFSSYETIAKIWNPNKTPPIVTCTGHMRYITEQLAFSPDGTTLATASAMGTIKLWDLNGNCLTTLGDDTDHFFKHIAFSPDGKSLATASDNGTIRLWDLNPLHYLCKPAEQS